LLKQISELANCMKLKVIKRFLLLTGLVSFMFCDKPSRTSKGKLTSPSLDTFVPSEICKETHHVFKGTLVHPSVGCCYSSNRFIVIGKDGQEKEFNLPSRSRWESSLIDGLEGKSVKVCYNIINEPNPKDILIEGKSIHSEYGGISLNSGKVNPIWKVFTGVLVTPQDAKLNKQGVITVTSKEEEVLMFSDFIYSEYVSAQGKTVLVYYTETVWNEAILVEANY